MFNRESVENEALRNITEQVWFDSLLKWAERSTDQQIACGLEKSLYNPEGRLGDDNHIPKIAQMAFSRLFHLALQDIARSKYGK